MFISSVSVSISITDWWENNSVFNAVLFLWAKELSAFNEQESNWGVFIVTIMLSFPTGLLTNQNHKQEFQL